MGIRENVVLAAAGRNADSYPRGAMQRGNEHHSSSPGLDRATQYAAASRSSRRSLEYWVPAAAGDDNVSLSRRLHLRRGLRHHLVHARAQLRLGDGDTLGGEVARHLVHDVVVAGLLEIRGDNLLGLRRGGIA
jgi:hypothetical protein